MKLRVAVLLDSAELYAWEYSMLQRIENSDYAEIVKITVGDTKRTPALLDPQPRGFFGAALLRVYRALEAKINVAHDAFAVVDAAEFLKRARSAGDDVDVILNLTFAEALPGLPASATYGVWSLRHDGVPAARVAAAAFWPVCTGSPTIVSHIEALDRRGSRPLPLRSAHTVSGTNPFAVKLNRSALYWKTSSLIPRALQELQRSPGVAAAANDDTSRSANPEAARSRITTRDLGRHIARNVRLRARERKTRQTGGEEWSLLVHPGEDLSLDFSTFKPVTAPRGRYWADPHILQWDGRCYVFFEEFLLDVQKGRIGVVEVDDSGRCSRSEPVLEREYHLSYPCVFEDGGDLFMIPEASANRTVDLYRCSRFPTEWRLERTLLANVAAVDTTVLRQDGRWWFFMNIAENEGASYCDELFLFHADSLDGHLTPHAANPVISDVRTSRPAGAMFRRGGEIYRPSQDCSVRYGYAMHLNRITHLSESDYAETPVQTIQPDWDPGVLATHTLAYAPGLTVIDVLRRAA